jgi:hypothetical protein
MTTADVTRADAPPSDRRTPPASVRETPPSPVVSFSWLLRTAAIASVAGGAMGVVVAPGMRGNANEPAVVVAEDFTNALACFALAALWALFLEGALDLLRARQVPAGLRAVLIGGGAAVVAISAAALRDRLAPPLALIVTAFTAVVALCAAYCGARAPHTRALSGVLVTFALAAIVRLGAWEIATRAGETANIGLFGWSRSLATAGVVLEAAGQLIAVTWLSTRGRWSGQLASTLALVVALVLTWGVARGVHSGASLWQSVVHSALSDAPGVPAPYRLDALATFLVPASLLLALVSAMQPRQVVALVSTMALVLVSRGSFDAPLRALCAVGAAHWVVLAGADPKAMWRTLIDERARRLADAATGEDEGSRR